MDLRQTRQYSQYMKSLGWEVETVNDIQIYLRKILFGKVMKIQRPESISQKDLELIDLIAKKERVFQIIVEPTALDDSKLLMANGYNQTHPYVPSKTIHIDLTKSEDILLKDMSQKTRYNIKIAKKNGVEVIVSNNINEFVKFWNKCALERRNFPQTNEITALYKAFRDKASILFAYQNSNIEIRNPKQFQNSKTLDIVSKLVISNSKLDNKSNNTNVKQPIAAIMLIHTKNVSYYMYAASSKEGKKLFAPTLLVWEAIKLAKKRDAKIFDFEGIYDERFPLSSWKGFSKFKLGFGGKVIEHPGAFTKWRLPI